MITDRQARILWRELPERMGTKVRSKDRAIMRIAGRIVERRTGMSREDFANEYVTTIGRRIWLPAGFDEWNPTRRVRLAVHEHEHVAHWREMGRIRYMRRYARSTRARAKIEVRAMVAAETFIRSVFGVMEATPIGNRVFDGLAGYGFDEPEREQAASDAIVLLSDYMSGRRAVPTATAHALQIATDLGWGIRPMGGA